tara:strand:+ start:1172 stop:1801 length:630 start_codon:yes stop_codon:yes gene_type:complete
MNTELVKRILSSIIIIPLVFYFLISGSFFLVFFLIICFIIAFYEWIKISKKTSYKIFGFIFLSFSFFTFYDLSIELFPLIFVILISISTDVGGYIFGKIFKGPKLTRISPNKTYAGMVGGYLLSLACLLIITNFIDYKMTPFRLFFITILLSTISQIGDIIISYFKRKAKIKNTGNLIPGHGGILDRIDGIIFSVPALYLIDLTGFLQI